MKQIRPLSVFNFILILVPWTILILRQYDFALQSPTAEIIIAAYCVFIAAAFTFSVTMYAKKKMRDVLSSIALVVNSIYLAGVVGLVCISLPGWLQ